MRDSCRSNQSAHSTIIDSQGGTHSIHDRGVQRSFILRTQKIYELEILHPQKYLTSKFSIPKKQDLNTSSLDLLTQNYLGCKFSTHKNTSDPAIMYTVSIPLGIGYVRLSRFVWPGLKALHAPPRSEDLGRGT